MAVACGRSHTLVVGEHGDVFACGRGAEGQLGRGTRDTQRTPALVPGLWHARVVMVAAGCRHSAASTSAGELLVWGLNENGQLGLGDREDRTAPATLRPERFGGSPVLMVACGASHTVAVTEMGRVFTFGIGGEGQLGLGDRNDRDAPVEVEPARFGGVRIVHAAAGTRHSGVVTSDGRVYTWGWGTSGQLGHDDIIDELVPRELVGQFGGSAAVMLVAGRVHTVFLMTDGAVWACGSGQFGQLGLGDTAERLVPARVGSEEAFGQSKVLNIACGGFHSMAVTEEGGLWSWGRGAYGQLGHNDQGNRLVPTRVATERFSGAKVVTADGGGHHSAAVMADGAVYTWGRAKDPLGPVGLGHDDLDDKIVVVPTLVEPRHLLAPASAAASEKERRDETTPQWTGGGF